MGLFFEAAHGLGRSKKPPSLKYFLHILQWWHLAQLYHTQRRSKNYINHVTHHLSSAEISIFQRKSANFAIPRNRLHLNSSFLTLLTFFESLKVFLIMVGILLTSAFFHRRSVNFAIPRKKFIDCTCTINF